MPRAFVVPTPGQDPWDGPLNTALANLDGRVMCVAYNVVDYGAKADGTTNDQLAIQSALNAAAATGGQVLLPPAVCAISTPLVLPPNVTLEGQQGLRVYRNATQFDSPPTATLKALSGFSGVAGVSIVAKAVGGYANESTGQRIRRVNVDMSAATGSAAGISMAGYIRDVLLDQVWIFGAPGNGIDTSGSHPYSMSMRTVVAQNCGGAGFALNSVTDTTMYDCEAIGCTGNGFSVVQFQNGHMTDCRAEFNGGNGFDLSGNWQTGASAGGCALTGCSTDRNTGHGINITSTGSGPILLNGCMLRRDGSNGTGAGLRVSSAATPVVVEGLTVFPGVADDGTGTNSPVTGLSVTGSTLVTVADSFIHAATSPISDGGTNTIFQRNNVITATGTTASPVYAAPTAAKLASTTIANTPSAGSTYRLVAWGTGGVTGTPNLTFNLRVGGVAGSLIGQVVVTAASSVTGKSWRAEGDVMVTATGSSGVWKGTLQVVTDLNTVLPSGASANSQANATPSTQSDKDIVLTATWSAASTSNTLTCNAAYAYPVMSA
jgi:hypothetical protein